MLTNKITKTLRVSFKSLVVGSLSLLAACNGDVSTPGTACEEASLSFENNTATCFGFIGTGTGVDAYAISKGSFTTAAGNTFPLPGGSSARKAYNMDVHPSGNFLYVPGGNSKVVSVFRIDAATGALDSSNIDQMQASGSVGIDYRKLTIHSSGDFLFSFEKGLNGNIQAFNIDNDPESANYGEITMAGGFKDFSSISNSNDPYALSPQDSFLYVIGVDHILANGVNTSHYRLLAYPVDISSNKKVNNNSIFQVNSDDTVSYTAVETSTFNANHIVWVATASTLQSFQFVGDLAAPEWQNFSDNSGLSNPKVIRVANNRFVYVGDDTGIHGFDISDPGQAAVLSSIDTPTDMGAVSHMYIDPDGTYLFTNGADNMFRIDPATGKLTQLQNSGFPGINESMVIMPRRF